MDGNRPGVAAISARNSVPESASSAAGAEPDQATIDAHRLLVMWLFVATALVSLFLIVILLVSQWTGQTLPFLLIVVFAGALGGFVSSLRRLYGFQDIFPRKRYVRLFRKTTFYVIAYSFVPALVGLIGAAVLYLIFAAGLIEGGLFPEFFCFTGEGRCRDFQTFMAHWAPHGPSDYAKALVWGFVAGFSERFVPDILNRFSNQEQPAEDSRSRALPRAEDDQDRAEPQQADESPQQRA